MFVVRNNKSVRRAKTSRVPLVRIASSRSAAERSARPGAITQFDVLLSNAGTDDIKQDVRLRSGRRLYFLNIFWSYNSV